MTGLEDMATALTATGNYRVLRRLVPRQVINEPDGPEVRHGIVLDTETTGLDALKDEIIELAMVPFTYSPDGRIFEVREAFHGLREPSVPITAEITDITGIDAAMVAGRTIDPDQVAEFVASSPVIIAHNAAFDRPFFERLCPAAAGKCWSCSMSEIDWRAEGFESLKLSTLLADIGLFYDRHRAVAIFNGWHIRWLPLPEAIDRQYQAQRIERARAADWDENQGAEA